ncbi:hypothetical protein ACFSQE_04140 [Vogesella fluminis]|uniref:hypothetical protein n=1 Tax=Vogesella fluminis TaxID=1069161 RepID=UPI001677BDC0|nr:hypothetical protein [Vogesella fluminis]
MANFLLGKGTIVAAGMCISVDVGQVALALGRLWDGQRGMSVVFLLQTMTTARSPA